MRKLARFSMYLGLPSKSVQPEPTFPNHQVSDLHVPLSLLPEHHALLLDLPVTSEDYILLL